MDAHIVLVPEGLTLGVDGHQADLGRLESVDPIPGSAAGMSFFAFIINQLCHIAHTHRAASGHFVAAVGVLHEHHIDIVEYTQLDEFLLAADKGQLALFDQAMAVFQLHPFFGRHTHQDDVAVQFAHNAAVLQRHSSTHDGGNLHMMAAGMGCTSHRVGAPMARRHDSIQLAHQSQTNFGRTALHGSNDAGDGYPILVFDAQLIQHFVYFLCGFEFLESQLRLCKDRFSKSDDFIGIFVHSLTGPALQFCNVHLRPTFPFPAAMRLFAFLLYRPFFPFATRK